MKTPKTYRTVFAIGLAVLSLTILVSSFARSSRAFTTTTVVNATQNEKLDFTLANETGYGIKKVYVGPNNNPDWTDDMEVLHGRTFKTGAELEITFSPKTRAAKWDLRVEWAPPYEKDPAVNWYGLDLTQIEKVTLLYDEKTGKTSIRKN
jgi:hypothetical protein